MSQGDITADEVYKDREMLERLGYGILDVAWGDSGAGFENIRDFSYVISPNQDPKMYRRLVFELLDRYFDNALAKAMWDKFIDHKWVLSEQAGKEIDLATAAKDWFEEHGHAFLKDWTFRQAVVPERIRYTSEPRKDFTGVVAGFLFPDLRELLDAGFTVTDIALAAVRSKRAAFHKSNHSWRSRILRFLPRPPSKLKKNGKPPQDDSPDSNDSDRQENGPNFLVQKVRPDEKAKFYIRLVANLTGNPINTTEEAVKRWREILEHKWFMSERKGDDVGIKTAALDYYRRLNLLSATEQGQES